MPLARAPVAGASRSHLKVRAAVNGGRSKCSKVPIHMCILTCS